MATMEGEIPRVARPASSDGLFFQTSVVCASIAVLGFLPTYWAPMVTGALKADPIIHLHALVFYCWSLFLVAQTWLGATRSLAAHRKMGLAAISLATIMTMIGIAAAINRMHWAAAIGQKEAGLAFAIVPLGGVTFFAIVFAMAVSARRRTETHKRLMLVAAISILDAPIARWFLTFLAPPGPPGPPPVAVDLGPALVALLLLIAVMIVDWRRVGRVHPAFWASALAYAAWKLIQVPLSATPLWHAAARGLMALGG